MSLSIVEANPNKSISGVSDKEYFFVNTQRKNIAELLDTKQVTVITLFQHFFLRNESYDTASFNFCKRRGAFS